MLFEKRLPHQIDCRLTYVVRGVYLRIYILYKFLQSPAGLYDLQWLITEGKILDRMEQKCYNGYEIG
jgi:hypothetical protein